MHEKQMSQSVSLIRPITNVFEQLETSVPQMYKIQFTFNTH